MRGDRTTAVAQESKAVVEPRGNLNRRAAAPVAQRARSRAVIRPGADRSRQRTALLSALQRKVRQSCASTFDEQADGFGSVDGIAPAGLGQAERWNPPDDLA